MMKIFLSTAVYAVVDVPPLLQSVKKMTAVVLHFR